MVQDVQFKIGQICIFLANLTKMSIFGHLCMGLIWSLFDTQRHVIPLWIGLTKLYYCCFMTEVLFISQNLYFFAPECRL